MIGKFFPVDGKTEFFRGKVPLLELYAPCGFDVVRIDPLHFPTRCHRRRLNKAPSLSIGFFECVAVYYGHFYVALVFIAMRSVSSLLLVKLSVLAE